ncbi:hypothetical protein DGMP_06580 [Desulfomarina profundi]|uniref:Uncharacterized protein n=1 Tax=Desulfomarina profundi TaxID=2772557 RepID=A0A8D5FG67_9BACT|nr:hypothetical protein [Desulfomarina profundi]BCL59965.1 hypothetical protein DGMP_06580 [Desulfomarina profundi]
MATAREHMLADARALFDSADGPAVDEVVDGVPLRAIVRGLEPDPAKYDRLFVERVALWLFPGDLDPFPRTGARVLFRGHDFKVEMSSESSFSDHLILVRFVN